jgi:hypothetical protein
MDRTIKEAMIKRYHCDTHSQLERQISDIIAADNLYRRLNTIQDHTLFGYI